MKFDTAFSCGDKGWVYYDSGPRQLTIGQIRIEYTNSPGMDGEETFANYRAHAEEMHEYYMCVETGIGSGNVWELGKNIFRTEAECIEGNKERIAEQERAKSARAAWEREQLLSKEASIRATLAQIEAAKAGAA